MNASELPPPDVSVPFALVVKMVRQLTHDVRNGLNAMELQTAYVADLLRELGGPAEAPAEMQRLRGMIAENARTLQRFSAHFWVAQPDPVRYLAKYFVEDFRTRLTKTLPSLAPQIAWTEVLADEAISVDVEPIFAAIGEVFQNAADFRKPGAPVSAHASVGKGFFQIELREERPTVAFPPASWGVEPLLSTRHGGYGLGLFHARQILAAHGGSVASTHDPAAARLTTRIRLPLLK